MAAGRRLLAATGAARCLSSADCPPLAGCFLTGCLPAALAAGAARSAGDRRLRRRAQVEPPAPHSRGRIRSLGAKPKPPAQLGRPTRTRASQPASRAGATRATPPRVPQRARSAIHLCLSLASYLSTRPRRIADTRTLPRSIRQQQFTR